jgi:hypothetical protein
LDRIVLQKETRTFFNNLSWTDPVAVTLTLKKARFQNGVWIKADEIVYSQNLRHFLNVLNKKLYGGRSRKGWHLSVASVLEAGASDKPHFHLLLDKPPHLSCEVFACLIQEIWSKTHWGHKIVDVSPEGGERWINYITKFRTKRDFGDAINWQNTHNSQRVDGVSFHSKRFELV